MRLGFVGAFTVLLGVTWGLGPTAAEDGNAGGPAGEKATAQDAAALSVALQHFGVQKDAPSFVGRDGKTGVLVHSESAGPARLYLSDDQLRADTMGEKWEVPAELREDLRRRNARRVPLGELAFGKGAVTADMDKALRRDDWRPPENHPHVRAYARVWLPAYSKDGRMAVVRFLFGPTPHGASATYLLTKRDGGWKVTKWKLAFYA
jgi:hypothetical protein